jgi:hypothetical protein
MDRYLRGDYKMTGQKFDENVILFEDGLPPLLLRLNGGTFACKLTI